LDLKYHKYGMAAPTFDSGFPKLPAGAAGPMFVHDDRGTAGVARVDDHWSGQWHGTGADGSDQT